MRRMPEPVKPIAERAREIMAANPDLFAALEHDDPSLIRESPDDKKTRKI